MVLFGLAAALALVVITTRLKLNMAHGLLAGCLLIALTSSMSPAALVKTLIGAWTEPRGVTLASVVALLMVLSQLQEETGQMERLFNRVRRLIGSPRLALTAFPALIGLLPMPGGAVFSAPMVEGSAKGACLEAVDKSVINVWFRHVWEYSWPLYPSLILISAMSGISLGEMMPYLVPVTLAAIVVGYLVILRRVGPSREADAGGPEENGSILALGAPILVVLIGALGGSQLVSALAGRYPALADLPGQAPMALALVLAVLLAGFQGGRLKTIVDVAFSRHTAGMLYLIMAILAFQAVASASGGVNALSRLMVEHELPLFALVICLPFIMGLITGIAVGYAATAFPVFIALLPPDNPIPYLMLGHAAGFAGVMTSPAHACIVLSNQYFDASSGRVFYRLWLPQGLTLAFAVAWALVLI